MSTAVTMTFGDYAFSPVPQVTLSKELVRDEIGNIINVNHRATLEGVVTPLPSGGFANLQPLVRNLENALLNCSGCQLFTLMCGSGYHIINAYAEVQSLNFAPSADNWVFTIPYTAELAWQSTSDLLTPTGETCFSCVQSTNEDWSFEIIENPRIFTIPDCTGSPTFIQVRHNISARGKNCCDTSGVFTAGYEAARTWVTANLGMDYTLLPCTGVFNFNPDNLNVYEHVRTNTLNERTGDFAVTESWIVVDQANATPCMEDYTVETSTSQDSPFRTINIQGTITGLEQRNPTNFKLITDKYANADACWTVVEPKLWQRVQCIATGDGSALCAVNPVPVTTTVSRSPGAGTIGYGYTYTDKPTLITGAKYENISVTDTLPSDRVTAIEVIGRTAGPVLFSHGSQNQRRRDVSVDIILPSSGCPTGTLCTDVSSLINGLPRTRVNALLCCLEQDLTNNYNIVHRVNDEETYSIWGTSYGRRVSWTYQDCSAPAVSGFCD